MDTKICARRGGGAQREGGPGGSEAHAAARHLRDARTLGVNRQARGGERVFPSTASGWDELNVVYAPGLLWNQTEARLQSQPFCPTSLIVLFLKSLPNKSHEQEHLSQDLLPENQI